MKKVLAILLSIAMLFGVLVINTFAETTTDPKVTIITNTGSPVDEGVTTYFTVRFDNFSSIKGVDVYVTVDNTVNFGHDVSFSGFAVDTDISAEGNYYTIDNDESSAKHILRFVDLKANSDTTSCKLVFGVSVPKGSELTDDPVINITGKYADSGKTLFESELPATGKFEIVKKVKEFSAGKPTDEIITITPTDENKFIPQGSVYIKTTNEDNTISYTYAQKTSETTFEGTDGNYTYNAFDKPDSTVGLTTFGVSKEIIDSTKLKFGNYCNTYNETATTKYGTMVFEGDYLFFKNYYIKKGYSVDQFVEAFYKSYDLVKPNHPDAKYVYYTLTDEDGTKKQLNVYKFEQTKYMYKNNDEGVLEYAIRLSGIKEDKSYAGIAYSVDGETVKISKEVKSFN